MKGFGESLYEVLHIGVKTRATPQSQQYISWSSSLHLFLLVEFFLSYIYSPTSSSSSSCALFSRIPNTYSLSTPSCARATTQKSPNGFISVLA